MLNCFVKEDEILAKKVDLDDNAVELILKAYNEFVNGEYQEKTEQLWKVKYFITTF